jgi:hypothetical protein
MPYNLTSPNGILERCELPDIKGWFVRELTQVSSPPEQAILSSVSTELDAFVRWPAEAILLWPGCNRIPLPGNRQKYFSYPAHIREMAKARGVVLDTRPNGPAIAAFILAGGIRPERFGSSNAWSVHHLYSGKFPYIGRKTTTHAAKESSHFTQSAGLVAAHPIADALVDEFPFFAWLLRAQAYLRFGYDPDGVFSSARDEYGFAGGRQCRVVEATG